jgi:hypothetical protein
MTATRREARGAGATSLGQFRAHSRSTGGFWGDSVADLPSVSWSLLKDVDLLQPEFAQSVVFAGGFGCGL